MTNVDEETDDDRPKKNRGNCLVFSVQCREDGEKRKQGGGDSGSSELYASCANNSYHPF